MCGVLMDHGGAAAVQAAVGGPALLAKVTPMSSEAESRRSLDSRGLNRGVRRCCCHAAVQLPRPGWLVAERTGIRQHVFRG